MWKACSPTWLTQPHWTSSIVAGIVYVNFGMEVIGLLAATAIAGAFVALWRGVKEPGR